MSASIVFNLYAPNVAYFSGSPVSSQLTIENYQAGNFLSIFSGSYILVENAKYWSDFGISASSSGNSAANNLYINNNTYLTTGSDIEYTVNVYNFIVGIPISFYSASTIGNITSLTIRDFTVRET
ncbi:MAG: hypothetical protein M0Q12_05720 [Synergistaceae bacterium]|jgi:hypothetical protein|nr:hypothetical protein [Synergistaceae bacterium]